MKISEFQQEIDSWIHRYGVRYFNPLTNTSILMEEVGELARIMARRYGEQSWKNPLAPEMEKERLADEMADVLWVIGCLANQCEIDLTEAILANLEKKTQRDHRRHIDHLGSKD